MRLYDFMIECKEVIEDDKEQQKKKAASPKHHMKYRPKRRSRR